MAKVTAALKSVPGVRTCEVDFQKKEAYVAVEKASLDKDALLAALKKAGYDASVKAEAP